MKHFKGTLVPFFLSLCSPLQRNNALLGHAVESLQARRYLDALLAAEYVCRRLPKDSMSAILRARIAQECLPQVLSKAWFRAWCREPENVLLQDAMLQVWLNAGAKATVAELGPAFLPKRCQDGKESSLLALLKGAGMDRVGACWRNEQNIEGIVYQLAESGNNQPVALCLSNGEQQFEFAIPPNQRFSFRCPDARGTWSLAFAHVAQANQRAGILHGSPVVFPAETLALPAARAALNDAPPADAKAKSKSKVKAESTGNSAARRPVDIIIPVYRDAKLVKACIESVLASLPLNKTSASIIAIDDASPEPALSAWLDQLHARGLITLLRNQHNLGFIETTNRGLRCHPEHDAIFLNSDTLVHGDWIDRMADTLYSASDVAAVTTWSNNGEITSFPAMSEAAAGPTADQLAEIDNEFASLRKQNLIQDAEVPVCCGFNMMIRRSVLDEIGVLDGAALVRGYGEEVDWCLRAKAAGYRHLVAAGVFVAHTGTVSFRFEKTLRVKQNRAVVEMRYPGFYDSYDEFNRRDPLKDMREKLFKALEAREAGWLKVLEEEQQALLRESRFLPPPLPTAVKRIAVWDHRTGSPVSARVVELARIIAASMLPVRLLVFGDASEALWHTGVVDVMPSQASSSAVVIPDIAFIGWSGCETLLVERGSEPRVLQNEVILDAQFNPQAWFAEWVKEQIKETPRSASRSTTNKKAVAKKPRTAKVAA
jgi:GT2 family glycosyltransferase